MSTELEQYEQRHTVHLSWSKLPNGSTFQWKLQQPCFSRALLQRPEVEGRQVTGCHVKTTSLQSALVSAELCQGKNYTCAQKQY